VPGGIFRKKYANGFRRNRSHQLLARSVRAEASEEPANIQKLSIDGFHGNATNLKRILEKRGNQWV
jgi:hypothetical protein